MGGLAQEQCQPPEGFGGPLSAAECRALLPELHPDWELNSDQGLIQRTFNFSDYYPTIAFVNAVAWIAQQQDHHPDLAVGYNRCQVRFATHAVGGLSRNDFICAARIDALLQS